jgi:hypothetical protein
MADSIEQKIIAAIVERLGAIDGTGDYQTEIGARVEDSRANWDESEMPAISVFQGTATTVKVDDEESMVLRKFGVIIRCVFKSDDDAGTDAAYARKTISDIYRAIRLDRHWRTDIDDPRTALAYMTKEVSHGIEYVPNTYEISGTQTEIEVSYFGTNFDMEA